MGGAASGVKAGALAGLLLAVREIMRYLTVESLHAPAALARSASLLIATHVAGGVILGLAAGALVVLIGAAGADERARASAARVALAAAVLLVVSGALGHGEQPAMIWLEVLGVALALLAGDFAGLWDLAAPAPAQVGPVVGVVAADAALFGGLRLAGRAWEQVALHVATVSVAIVVSAAIGYAVFVAVRAVAGQAGGENGARRAAVTLLVIAVAAVALLAGWQVMRGPAPVDGAAVERAAGGASDANGRPNIILLSIDALRWDYLAHNGGPARTPTLDALAEECHVFERCYSVAPWTRPSFASVFTGLYPHEMGVARIPGTTTVPFAWDAEPETLTEIARDVGYTTLGVITNRNLTVEAHADQGFAHLHHCSDRPAIQHARAAVEPLGVAAFGTAELERAQPVAAAVDDVLARAPARPVLLWVHLMDPHVPYDSPRAPPELRVELSVGEMANGPGDSRTRRRFVEAYTAEIEYCDTWVARIVRTLKERGLWESSVVILWSDHGEEFWDHGGWEHSHTLYNELLHVPLMVRAPGQGAGGRFDEPVSLLDVMPTVLDLCGMGERWHGRGDGRSLAPLLEGGEVQPFRVFLEGCSRGSIRKGLVTGRYKLIYDVYRDRFALYDQLRDPAEQHDIHGRPGAPDTTRWEEELREWTERSQAAMMRVAGAGAESISPETMRQLRDMGYVQ